MEKETCVKCEVDCLIVSKETMEELKKLSDFFSLDPVSIVASLIKTQFDHYKDDASRFGLKYAIGSKESEIPLSSKEVNYLKQAKAVLNPNNSSMTPEDWKNLKKTIMEVSKELNNDLPGEEWKKDNVYPDEEWKKDQP